jgi:NAD-dependent dihydropyrimidine dehydrogenase PreA subunit
LGGPSYSNPSFLLNNAQKIEQILFIKRGGKKMNAEDKLYRDLQLHLDDQTIGFPATDSGSDIRLLKQLFPPEQAKMAMMLTYKYETLEQIHERASEIGVSMEELERVLDETAKRGVIGRRKKEGVKQYRNIPYIVGMGEARAHNPSPESTKAAEDYHQDGVFWGAFLNTKVPQMRAIPIEQSITPVHTIGTYDEIKKIIETTPDPIAIIECVCRNGAERRGEPCKQTSRKETCMGFRDGAQNVIDSGRGRPISKEEALAIIRKNEEEGMVLQPSNAQEPDFICSCCGCCCGILRLHKAVPNPVDHWATNFYAEVDADLCTGCETCVETCPADAMSFDEENGISTVDLTRCLGCGNCVVNCPDEVIELRRKEAEVVPPQTGEDMYEVIMTNKM